MGFPLLLLLLLPPLAMLGYLAVWTALSSGDSKRFRRAALGAAAAVRKRHGRDFKAMVALLMGSVFFMTAFADFTEQSAAMGLLSLAAVAAALLAVGKWYQMHLSFLLAYRAHWRPL